MKPQITAAKTELILHRMGCATARVCLLGVRGYYKNTMGIPGQNDRGIYDDALIWWSPTLHATFQGNTDPSRYRKGWGFGSEKGMAQLKTGVWTYKMGIHYGSVPHAAFRQAAKVTVLRDGTKGQYEDTGWFGINIHRGGAKGTSSLGCQTLPAGTWDAFKSIGYSALKSSGQETFQYCLINEQTMNELLGST